MGFSAPVKLPVESVTPLTVAVRPRPGAAGGSRQRWRQDWCDLFPKDTAPDQGNASPYPPARHRRNPSILGKCCAPCGSGRIFPGPVPARNCNPIPREQAEAAEVFAEKKVSQHRELVFGLVLSEEETFRRRALVALESLVIEDDIPRLIRMLTQCAEPGEKLPIQMALTAACRSYGPGFRPDRQ